jgi:hypothetical protein
MSKKIIIELTLHEDADSSRAEDIVDQYLDGGALQDEINDEAPVGDLELDDRPPTVTDASCYVQHVSPQGPPAPKPRENCECENGGARLGFLHIDNSEDYPTLGDDGQHIERCDYCAVFPDDESADAAHAAHCDCGWGERLLPICPRCGEALAERDDCMACACGYRVATSWWREAIAATCETCNLAMHLITKGDPSGTEVYQCPKCEHEIAVGDLARIQRGCPAGCDCERCRPELYVK